MLQSRPQIFAERTRKRTNQPEKLDLRTGEQSALLAIRSKLHGPRSAADVQNPLQGGHVPADDFSLPTAGEHIVALRIKTNRHRLGFMRSQRAQFASMRIQQMDLAALIDNPDPAPARMP